MSCLVRRAWYWGNGMLDSAIFDVVPHQIVWDDGLGWSVNTWQCRLVGQMARRKPKNARTHRGNSATVVTEATHT